MPGLFILPFIILALNIKFKGQRPMMISGVFHNYSEPEKNTSPGKMLTLEKRCPLLPRTVDGAVWASGSPVSSVMKWTSVGARHEVRHPSALPARCNEVQRRYSPPRQNSEISTRGPTELERRPTPSAYLRMRTHMYWLCSDHALTHTRAHKALDPRSEISSHLCTICLTHHYQMRHLKTSRFSIGLQKGHASTQYINSPSVSQSALWSQNTKSSVYLSMSLIST